MNTNSISDGIGRTSDCGIAPMAENAMTMINTVTGISIDFIIKWAKSSLSHLE